MDHRPSEDLLESAHSFPGVYQIKVIGSVDGGFEERVMEAVVEELASISDVNVSVRGTPTGRHVALTLEVNVQSAEQVRVLYAKIREVEGLLLLL